MTLINTMKFIWRHPLNAGKRTQAVTRFAQWQIGSRILGEPTVWTFVNDARLLVRRGMTAATGNIYVGLMEFEEMCFLLHYLRPTDLFFDVGANVGVYTVLAAKVVGSKVLSIEPVPSTFDCLRDNINLNNISDLVEAFNVAVGGKKGTLAFCTNRGSTNHVIPPGSSSRSSADIDVLPLDDLASTLCPEMIKIDVEGFESEVLAGGMDVFSRPTLNVVSMELRGHGKRYGFDERAIDRQMQDLGFEAYSYDPFTRSIDVREQAHDCLGDMLYIRDVDRACDRVASAPSFSVAGRSL